MLLIALWILWAAISVTRFIQVCKASVVFWQYAFKEAIKACVAELLIFDGCCSIGDAPIILLNKNPGSAFFRWKTDL